MKKYLIKNPTTSALLGSCVVLLLTVTFQWLSPYQARLSEIAAEAGLASTDIAGTTPPRYVHPQMSNFQEVIARPIFFSNRQMPPKPVAEAATPRAPLRLKLEGIATAADNRVAILRDLGSNQLVQLREGMTHNSWLLDEMTSTTVTFRRDAEVSKISLDTESNR